MSTLYCWIPVFLSVTLLFAVGQCQNSVENSDAPSSAPISTVVEEVSIVPLELNLTESSNNTTDNNNNNKTSPTGWRLLIRKFFDRPSSQEKHADKNRIILENLTLRQAENADSPGRNSAVAFHDEETVAVITYADKNVESCKLMEVNYRYQAVEVLKNLSLFMPIYPVDTRTMVKLIKQCQTVRGPIEVNRRGSASRAMRADNPKTNSSVSWTTFVTTIVPGTKWCGPGDVASSYDDLGAIMDVDKCCRAHDHCPIKVKGFASAHGLMNLSFYTKSHCACDDEFFSCLKSISSPVSKMIGNLYFNVIQMPCVDELQLTVADGLPKTKLEILTPELCTARMSTGECTGPSVRRPFQPRPYKFININREF